MCNEISYLFSNFNGCTVEDLGWISTFISQFLTDVITYPCWDYDYTLLVEGAPGCCQLFLYYMMSYPILLWCRYFSPAPCTALLVGNLLAFRVVQRECQWPLKNDGSFHRPREHIIHCQLSRIQCIYQNVHISKMSLDQPVEQWIASSTGSYPNDQSPSWGCGAVYLWWHFLSFLAVANTFDVSPWQHSCSKWPPFSTCWTATGDNKPSVNSMYSISIYREWDIGDAIIKVRRL